MKLLYKPFGIVIGIIAGILARQVFEQVWAQIDDRKPPKPDTLEASWGKAIGAAAVEGATFAATKAAVNRSGVQGFHYLTGIWAGDKRPDLAE